MVGSLTLAADYTAVAWRAIDMRRCHRKDAERR